jgi:hypothetical protein
VVMSVKKSAKAAHGVPVASIERLNVAVGVGGASVVAGAADVDSGVDVSVYGGELNWG